MHDDMIETIPERMCAVLLTGHGGFDRLEYREDVPVPRPGAGEVLIRVAAAGINNTDINTRIGWYSKNVNADSSSGGAGGLDAADAADASWTGAPLRFPRIQGADCCGHIVATGDGVPPVRIGERVIVPPLLRHYRGFRPFESDTFGSEVDGAFAPVHQGAGTRDLARGLRMERRRARLDSVRLVDRGEHAASGRPRCGARARHRCVRGGRKRRGPARQAARRAGHRAGGRGQGGRSARPRSGRGHRPRRRPAGRDRRQGPGPGGGPRRRATLAPAPRRAAHRRALRHRGRHRRPPRRARPAHPLSPRPHPHRLHLPGGGACSSASCPTSSATRSAPWWRRPTR